MGTDTIVAISTPPGRSALSVVRSSGPSVREIVVAVAGVLPPSRQAHYGQFAGRDGEAIDDGILLFFQGPRSFTGEDVAEFHIHGGPVVSQLLFETMCALGARPARPGEFSERAFRNGKIDLAQAEAIADLINSRSVRAARSAVRTLRGEFSAKANALAGRLHLARARLEAAIDFPEDVAPSDIVEEQFAEASVIRKQVNLLKVGGRQGAKLNHGGAVVLVGLPNVGKSTLINAMVGENKAIVSEIPGTTRDVIEADAVIHDLPVRFYDTAGLCEADNPIEREGVARAIQLIQDADVLIILTEDFPIRTTGDLFQGINISIPDDRPILIVHNKIDLHSVDPHVEEVGGVTHVFISALEKTGLVQLKEILAEKLGFEESGETEFAARERHLAALDAAGRELEAIEKRMIVGSPEVVAECYRRAERALGEITGAFSTEDLLGEIFSRFCIGK